MFLMGMSDTFVDEGDGRGLTGGLESMHGDNNAMFLGLGDRAVHEAG